MRIMPLKGNDIGFTSKAWRHIEASVSKKAQADVGDNQDVAYWMSLADLTITAQSARHGSDKASSVVRSPSSLWGGKEVNVGNDNYLIVKMSLEGAIVLPPKFSGIPDDEIKKQIEQDFSDSWEDNPACFQTVSEHKQELHGSRADGDYISVTVKSFSTQTDGSATVVIDLQVTSFSHESEMDAGSRHNDEH